MSKLHAIIGSLICAMNWTRRGTPKMSNLNNSRWKRQTWTIHAENTITACFTQAKRICKQETYTVYRQKHSTTSAKNRKNHSFEKKSHWNSNFHGDNAALIALSTCQICWEKTNTIWLVTHGNTCCAISAPEMHNNGSNNNLRLRFKVWDEARNNNKNSCEC